MGKPSAYARTLRVRRRGVVEVWYQLFFDRPGEMDGVMDGPFPDDALAEDAAHDVAKQRGWNLEWTVEIGGDS